MLFIKIDRHPHTNGCSGEHLGVLYLGQRHFGMQPGAAMDRTCSTLWATATVFWTQNAKLRWVKVTSAKALALF